ncbi:spore germination protein GerPE [Paenibacillus sp.]|uniref:spore germination protein GerPE n=1 Tax=Paenibacillus sp. TaxID=58172 RepID=UPI002D2D2392|nr:spore germination protein GerPE [Paenibacillus sp.]HZG83960.1 spore germination protein GerPE [Paenibacillus sp.]
MNRTRRWSVVGDLYVNTLSNSGILLIGDGERADNRSRAIAVKREYPVFRGDEGSFERYALFRAAIPSPKAMEEPEVRIVNEGGAIRVGRVAVIAASNTAVVQIGSTGSVSNEARTKQFRQLLPETAAAQGGVPGRTNRTPSI